MLLLLTVICMVFLLRTILIAMGLYKNPLLDSFSVYGPAERPYLVGLPLLVWNGLMLLVVGSWAASFPSFSFALSAVGVLMGFLALLGYNSYDSAIRWHLRWFPFPLWYHELTERTTRYERRRIAFMWLHLPFKMRLTYNSSDRAFFIWADFVIMGTVREEEYDPQHDTAVYYGGNIGSL